MLHIILVILKIIGIVLAAVLSLLLLALLAALFVPLRYRIRLRREGEEIYAGGKFSYLFHIITVTAEYSENKTGFAIRILGIPLGSKKKSKENKKHNEKKKHKDKRKEKHKEKHKEKCKEKRKEKYKDNQQIEQVSGSEMKENDTAEKSLNSNLENTPPEKENRAGLIQIEENLRHGEGQQTETAQGQFYEEEKKHVSTKRSVFTRFIQAIRQFGNTIKNIFRFIRAIPEKIRNIGNIIKTCFAQFSKYWSLIRSEEAIALFGASRKELWYLLGHYKPKRAKGYIRFGTGDPASTGQILGAACLFFPIYSGKIQVIPDFENSIYEGSLQLNGHIRGCHLLKSGWKIYRNQNLKKFLKLRKE